ncbi:hypothetical protein GWK16_04770 [Roseomonas sp. JC162]|uniref:Uncharacterized protein n=1 Tax=Neoroseomonas marina TaxID=1232220 RepID=A0A848EAN3_9PROT|nr:hypothetical protein [Neoroseomonas marina]NMJ40540.1 hypothetical protein [Neoroseomonas marina]
MATIDPARGLAADLIAYVCSWAGFALASLPMTEALGRRALWPRMIAAWNWVNFVQYLVLAVLTLPAMLDAPSAVSDTLGLVGLGYAIWMQWFAARAALEISGVRAAAFVAIDLGLSVFLSGLTARIALG